MAWLKLENISKTLNGKELVAPTTLLVQQNEKLAIAGETGAGKSTLLKMIGGLVQPSSGQVFFQDQKVLGPDEQLLPGHKQMAYLSQHFELHNNYLVEEQIQYGNELSEKELQKLVEVCQIDHLLKRKTNSGLSGGERQRIVLAKLLATQPKLLLLDEPFSNLDAPHKQTIRKVIADMGLKLGISVILISHDAIDMLSWADRIAVMKAGRIIQLADPLTIYRNPVNTYVAGLFGHFNLLNFRTALSLDLPPLANEDQAWMVRPEDWLINQQDSASIHGQVKSVQFCGSYFLMEVETVSTTLLVSTPHESLQTSHELKLSIAPGKASLLNR